MTQEEAIALRDEFAKGALQGILSSPRDFEGINDLPKNERNKGRAELAYEFADLMMTARSQ